MEKALELVGAVTSRICHDLANPLGAIGNGIELLELSGANSSELDLLKQSFETAENRLKLFRLAFGYASTEQRLSTKEFIDICKTYSKESRITVEFDGHTDIARSEGKILILLLQCLETIAPFGAAAQITIDPETKISATAKEFRPALGHWDMLKNSTCPNTLPATAIHYGIAHASLQQLQKQIEFSVKPQLVVIRLV